MADGVASRWAEDDPLSIGGLGPQPGTSQWLRDRAVHLNNVAAVYQRRGSDDEAERLYRRALAMKEKLIGPDHPVLANTLNNLAVICRCQGRPDEAERLYARALQLLEAGVDPGHPTLATTRRNYTALVRTRQAANPRSD